MINPRVQEIYVHVLGCTRLESIREGHGADLKITSKTHTDPSTQGTELTGTKVLNSTSNQKLTISFSDPNVTPRKSGLKISPTTGSVDEYA